MFSNKTQQNLTQRHIDRLTLINDTMLADFQGRLRCEAGFETIGMEEGLRLLLARHYWASDPMEAAASELHRSLVLQEAMEAHRLQSIAFAEAERQQDALDDMLLERELRYKAGMVYFRKNENLD